MMLTWEVLSSVYPTHTYHMEDNASYRDIVVTRNVIAKVIYFTMALLVLLLSCFGSKSACTGFLLRPCGVGVSGVDIAWVQRKKNRSRF